MPSTASSLVRVSRGGQAEPIRGSHQIVPYHTARLSPDGRRAAVDVGTGVNGQGIWVLDLELGTRALITRMTAATTQAWSPDGSELAFSALGEPGSMNVFRKSSDGAGGASLLFIGHGNFRPLSWRSDGSLLTMTEINNAVTGHDVWLLSAEGKAEPFVVTDANENAARFSPDGSWIAYQSDQSGRFEIYVRPFPGPGTRVLVSTDGGKAPVWRLDGSELFYRQGRAVMAVSVRTAPTFVAGPPTLLFDGPYEADNTGHPAYDVFPDGEHFLMIVSDESVRLDIVLNWFAELNRLVPAGDRR